MKKNGVHLNQTKSKQLYLSYLRSLNKNQRGEAIFWFSNFIFVLIYFIIKKVYSCFG